MKTRWLFLCAAVAATLIGISSCGRVSVDVGGNRTGERITTGARKLSEIKDAADAWKEALNQIRPQDERAIGQACAISLIARSPGLVEDEPLNNYVNQVGNLVALYGVRLHPSPKKPRMPSRRFYFGILDEPEPTAYSLPGGHVFVTRGLLEQLTSESELAFVLAHEIAHVDMEHGLFALQSGKGIPAAAPKVISLFKKNKVEDRWTEVLWDNAEVFDGTVESAVDAGISWLEFATPGQERDADALGLQYAVKAGYDSRGAERVLEMLANTSSASGGKSHDPAKERLERLRDAIAKEDGGATGFDRWNKEAAPRLGMLMARSEESAP